MEIASGRHVARVDKVISGEKVPPTSTAALPVYQEAYRRHRATLPLFFVFTSAIGGLNGGGTLEGSKGHTRSRTVLRQAFGEPVDVPLVKIIVEIRSSVSGAGSALRLSGKDIADMSSMLVQPCSGSARGAKHNPMKGHSPFRLRESTTIVSL
jgi:hypothetical protein